MYIEIKSPDQEHAQSVDHDHYVVHELNLILNHASTFTSGVSTFLYNVIDINIFSKSIKFSLMLNNDLSEKMKKLNNIFPTASSLRNEASLALRINHALIKKNFVSTKFTLKKRNVMKVKT